MKKYHANIHKALKYAVRDELIPTNPADSIDLPKVTKYRAGFYSIEEAEELFAAVKGTKMEAPIKLATIFGLRREEVLGLRWSAIDLKEQKLTIDHTCILIGAKIKNVDATKNESSHRMLYLTDDMTSFLKSLKIRQRESKLRYGEDYVDSGYVCVHTERLSIFLHTITHPIENLCKIFGMPLVGSHLNRKLAFIAIQYETTRLFQ